MKIYPELVRDKIWVEFSESSEKESKLKVLDDDGSLLILKRIKKAEKGDTFALDLSILRPGSYQLIIEIDNCSHLRHIVVE